MSLMQAINRDVSKIRKCRIKISKTITKFFGQEVALAIKNVKRNVVEYRLLTANVCISIIIFSVMNGFIINLFKEENNFSDFNDYCINASIEQTEQIIKHLIANGLIQDYFSVERITNWKIGLDKEKQTNELQEMIKLGLYQGQTQKDGVLNIDINPFVIYSKQYQEILRRIGIDELKKDEIVIINSIQLPGSKFGNEIPITTYRGYEFRKKGIKNSWCDKKYSAIL